MNEIVLDEPFSICYVIMTFQLAIMQLLVDKYALAKNVVITGSSYINLRLTKNDSHVTIQLQRSFVIILIYHFYPRIGCRVLDLQPFQLQFLILYQILHTVQIQFQNLWMIQLELQTLRIMITNSQCGDVKNYVKLVIIMYLLFTCWGSIYLIQHFINTCFQHKCLVLGEGTYF